ncbi:MAG: UDP-N-acetylmuramoyl-L-alanyl-D-glutamate--2,6-diaminopimelate ligase [Candidatus Solibacter usitatus]|nr:UDP-N-acetylmuramoyl-L-alanyl-D-glutamate--2,6-diaminopimelate ligase [Candidatus Solibacter usitatus]
MTIGEVFSGVRCRGTVSEDLASLEIRGLEYDSRRAGEGFLFFAFPGARTDGRRFAQDALGRGAVAVASESPRPEGFAGNWIEVEHGRRALALAARNFYGKLDRKIALTGITGTNGKTTVGFLADSVWRAAGKITALIGTIEYHVAGRKLAAVNTTPESLDLHRIFAALDRAGGTHATLEVSSHALALGRVYGLEFHTAVFTNLTRDHLDFHGTMEEYFVAKRRLFEGAGARPPRAVALNSDDAYARRIEPPPGAAVYWYGLGPGATVRASHISSTMRGLTFDVEQDGRRIRLESALVGRMNVYNILAAYCCGLSQGLEPEVIARGISECRAAPGRFERIDEGQPFGVVVDYAHTDDALRNTIAVARGLTAKRVITLFGCGGDRDRAKRPLMGQAAGEASDFVVLTSDNPRSEDPLEIINDALVGLRRQDRPHLIEPDRAVAIRRAIEQAREGDIVILAGKGHETYQVLGDRTVPFDDREVARQVLKGFGYKK